jgi:hypothetical protein
MCHRSATTVVIWFLTLPLLHTAHELSHINLLSPLFDATFMTFPPSTSATIPLKFQVVEESELPLETHTRVCFNLNSSENVIFDNHCVDSSNNNLNMNFVPLGIATLELYLLKDGEILPNSLIQSSFKVVSMESALPLLIPPSDLHYLANPQTDSSDASIEFFISEITLSKYLHVCLEVFPASLLVHSPHFTLPQVTPTLTSPSKFGLKRTCVPTDQNHLTLYHIPSGSYQLSLEFQQASSPYTPFPSSRKNSSITISRLQDLLPSLSLDHSILERGISADATKISEIILNVAARPHPSLPTSIDLLSHTETCLSLSPAPNSSLQSAFHCIITTPVIQFTFRLIPRGTHDFSVSLRSLQNPELTFPESTVRGQLIVEDMREFVPSYDWTELKHWHTIPSGLETRSFPSLPLQRSVCDHLQAPHWHWSKERSSYPSAMEIADEHAAALQIFPADGHLSLHSHG